MKNTKEEILVTALHLFARDGYEAVSVSQIAGELGMTKGALYRHYQNKKDIFLSIVKRMERRDAENAEAHEMPEGTMEEMPKKYQKVSAEEFLAYSLSMFSYWTEDDFAASFRKMLILEQFRNEEMQKLFQQYLVAGPVGYVEDLFMSMGMEQVKEKALQFYAMMYLYYSLYDGAEEKESVKQQFTESVEELIKKFYYAGN